MSMKIVRSKPFAWNATKDKKLGTIMCKSAKNGEPIRDGLTKASNELGCTMSVATNRWYTEVKLAIIKQYERAQHLAGVKAQVRLEQVIEIPAKEPEVKPVVVEDTPVAVVAEVTEVPATLASNLKELEGNAPVYNALVFLVEKFAKMDAKNANLNRSNKKKDQTIALKDEEIRVLNERLIRYRDIQQGK